MGNKYKIAVFGAFVLPVLLLIVVFTLLLHGHNVAVLQPRGVIAYKERNLIYTALGVMLLIVIPVFVLLGFISWHYRASNTKATYKPDWDRNRWLETIWWGFPLIIIIVLGTVTWRSTHELDPFQPLSSTTKPLTIQVVALDWKWLFIYPDQHIATVNYLRFPAQTPVNFEITADAPMNSFWIPQLGGQIYAMAGMSTELHLAADHPGVFRGSSANISGSGFAGMKFTAEATSATDFSQWAQSARSSSSNLNMTSYNQLALASKNNPATSFAVTQSDIYDKVLMKYMPAGMTHGMHMTGGGE